MLKFAINEGLSLISKLVASVSQLGVAMNIWQKSGPWIPGFLFSPRFHRVVIIIGVLLGGGVLAPLVVSGERLPLLVFLAYLAAVGMVVLLRKPTWGLVGLIITALIVPFSIGTGRGTPINAAVLMVITLIGLWFLEMIAHKKRIVFVHSRTVLPGILFAFTSVISFGFGQIQWFLLPSAPFFAQIGGLFIFVLSVGAFLLVAHQINDLVGLKWMSFTFVALGGIYLVGRLFPMIGWRISPIYQRAVLDSPFWIWLVVISFSQAIYNQELKFRWRAILFAILLGAFYINLVQSRAWTSGWLPSLTAVVVILWMGSSKKLRWVILITGLILIYFYSSVQSFVMTGDNEFSLETRLAAWGIIAQLVRVSPIFGLGFANYYWYTPLIPIMGYSGVFNSHNNYVDLIAQTGLVGLIIFLWFVFEIGLVAWRLRARIPKGFAQAYVFGAMGGLIAYLVAAMLGDWILPFVYNIGLNGFRASVLGWLFLGGLVALEKIYPTVEN